MIPDVEAGNQTLALWKIVLFFSVAGFYLTLPAQGTTGRNSNISRGRKNVGTLLTGSFPDSHSVIFLTSLRTNCP